MEYAIMVVVGIVAGVFGYTFFKDRRMLREYKKNNKKASKTLFKMDEIEKEEKEEVRKVENSTNPVADINDFLRQL